MAMPADIKPMKISVLLWSWKQEQSERENLLMRIIKRFWNCGV